MMRPLPEASSLDRLTLSPGEPSTRSTFGMESPALTMLAGVEWKARIDLDVGWRSLRAMEVRVVSMGRYLECGRQEMVGSRQ